MPLSQKNLKSAADEAFQSSIKALNLEPMRALPRRQRDPLPPRCPDAAFNSTVKLKDERHHDGSIVAPIADYN
jgi:hypothetical protein